MTTTESAAPGTAPAAEGTLPAAMQQQNAAPGTVQQQPAQPPQASLSAEDCAAIIDLCTMAGQPQMASGFIREGKSRGDVSEALLRARAVGQQSQQQPISTAHGMPEGTHVRSSDPKDPHGWNGSHERVFGSKGA
jgi:hypothetical protein